MKKLILLLLFTAIGYGQVSTGNEQPFYYGIQVEPTALQIPATVNYLGTYGTDGTSGRITPLNVTVPYVPLNYTILTPTLGGHLAGIDTKINTLSSTTAGISTRVWFTADPTTITAGTFYLTNALGKGTVASAIQNVVNNDDVKTYFAQDLIGIPFATATIFPVGVYAGNLSASTSPNSAKQKWTVELYKCDNNGTPIASGITGASIGDLGVTVITILDSGELNLVDGSITNVPVSGNLASPLSVAVGERIRYHVSAEKVGTAGANITQSVYYGTSYNSYLDVPVPLNTTAVQNLSTVVGATTTDALNTLNASKVSGTGASGQVSFWNGTNSQTGDNALFWDNVNKRFGLGTPTPGVVADIVGNSFATSQIRTASISNTDNSVLAFRRARAGTTAVLSGDAIGEVGFRGHDGTSYGSVSTASIGAYASENFTTGAKGSSIAFTVTPKLSATPINPFNIFGTSVNVYYDFANPTNIQAGFYSEVLGKGDNITYKGVSAGNFLAKDRPDVTAGNKGVLTALNASVYPTMARNNVPFDDVNGVNVNNDGTNKATDAYYISKNSISFPSTSQWSTLFSSDANADYGIRLNGIHTVGYLDFGGKFTVDNNGKLFSSHIAPLTNNTYAIGTDGTNYSYVRANNFTSNTALSFDTPNNNSISFAQGGVQKLRMLNTGNVVVQSGGTFTDAGFKLDVQGTGRFTGLLNLSGQTASTVAILDASKNLISASTATYPSLTELSYLKGVTAPISNTLSGTYTPTLTGTVNTSGVVLISANYTVIGNVVTVRIDATVDPISATTQTSFTATLPYTMSGATQTSLGSGCVNPMTDFLPVLVQKNSATLVNVVFKTQSDTNNAPISITFTYLK